MTAKEFLQNPSNSKDLKALTESPVFKRAAETVLFESIAHVDNLGLANDAAGNAKLQQLAGMKQFLRMLDDLAAGQAMMPKVSTPRLYTEADRDFLKQQQQQEQ